MTGPTRQSVPLLTVACGQPEPDLRRTIDPSEFAKDTEHAGDRTFATEASRFPIVPGVLVRRIVAHGSSGPVYRGNLIPGGRAVCVKVLSSHNEGKTVDQRLRREAFITAMLTHRHIVRAIDYGEVARLPYFVTEYLPGLSLDRLPPIGLAAVCEIGRQVASALAASHRSGVIHRDVKPGNIVVAFDSEGRPFAKLIDFGLARCSGDSNDEGGLIRPHQSLGSPPHVAPEQISHPTKVSPRTDLYSLGSTLFELVTGQSPFGSAVPESLVAKQKEEAPRVCDRRADVPHELDRLLAVMLRRWPDERRASASDVAARLADIARTIA